MISAFGLENRSVLWFNGHKVMFMKYYEVDLSQTLKVTLLGRSFLTSQIKHITRRTSEYIVYAVASGVLCLEENGQPLELHPGDIYVFDKGEFQKPLKNTECEFYYLHFVTDRFSSLDLNGEEFCETVKKRRANFMKADIYGAKSYDHIRAVVPQRLHVADKLCFEYILGFFKNNMLSYVGNDPLRRLGISLTAAELLMKLEELCINELCGGSRKKSAVLGTVERIAEYIGKHYTEGFGSEDIERDLFINFDYANRIFKRHFGYSIIQYRNRLRINTAKTLVGNMTLDEVAFEVGFGDRYYFSKCFKRFEGISPEEYRLGLSVKTKE